MKHTMNEIAQEEERKTQARHKGLKTRNIKHDARYEDMKQTRHD